MNTVFILVASFIFFVNIPFGYWRGNLRKFSLLWFLAIHIPVLFLIFIKRYFEIEFSIVFEAIILILFLIGQKLGGEFRKKFRRQ